MVLNVAPSEAQNRISESGGCAPCHGAEGISPNPLVPTLAGQPFTFIEDNLLAFRAGKRSCSETRADGSASASLAQTMCKLVERLPDKEIVRYAQYFSEQDFVAADQPFDMQLASIGSKLHHQLGCNRCHADGGSETLDIAPVLAGQWTPFLRRALHAVNAGLRKGPKEMNEPIQRLDAQQIEALLNFYASQNDPDFR